MRILLTGALGQLGRQIVVQNQGHQITAMGRKDLDISNLHDVREVVRSARPALVLNAAAFNDVDLAETDWEAAFRGNAVGPRNLALAAAEKGAAVLHVSTDYVFDGARTIPYHEYDVPAPLSNYGRSKLAGEQAVRDMNPRHYVVRTAWVYEAQGANFLKTLYQLAQEKKELRVVGDVKGSPTSARHLAGAILTLIKTGAFGTYHLTNFGAGASRFEVATRFFRELQMDTKIIPAASSEFPRPAPRPAYSVLRTIQEPRILLPSWQDGIAEFARELRAEVPTLAP